MTTAVLFHLAQNTKLAAALGGLTAADTWLLVFTGIVAISTVVYAFLTWRLVSETKRLRVAQTEPMVSVSYHPREEWINFIDFSIKNVGAGPALDIRLEVDPDFEYVKDKWLSELNLFKNGLKYLGPGEERRFFLTSLTEDGDAKVGTPFEVRVTYRGTIGGQKTDQFVINFSEWEGLMQLGKPPLHEIADSMKSLAKRLG